MSTIDIPGFEVLEKLGQGGMATVWKARQVTLDRVVAVKVMHPGLGTDESDIERFRTEAQSAAKLKHPGIVQVYEIVLPAFNDVRLIPVDASSADAAGGYNLTWREHVEVHLPGGQLPTGANIPGYINSGQTQPGCYYCQALRIWEPPPFRGTAIAWIRTNSQFCVTTGGGGGGGSGGGTRRGH